MIAVCFIFELLKAYVFSLFLTKTFVTELDGDHLELRLFTTMDRSVKRVKVIKSFRHWFRCIADADMAHWLYYFAFVQLM